MTESSIGIKLSVNLPSTSFLSIVMLFWNTNIGDVGGVLDI
jgi:hypothetical protein